MLTPIALFLQEMATNAVKYGALSSSSGKLEIAWHLVDSAEGRHMIVFNWREDIQQMIERMDVAYNHGYELTIVEASLRQLEGKGKRRLNRVGSSLS